MLMDFCFIKEYHAKIGKVKQKNNKKNKKRYQQF